MRKNTILRGCTYGLTGLISLTAVVISNTTAFTQVAIQQTPSSNTQFIWPTTGYISQGFRKYKHEGIDIAGPIGTPIMAAAAGTVIKVGWDEWGLGNAVEIKHSDGSVTVYGHNSSLLVSKGQQVQQGQIIAKMGSTGNSTGSHLHFEIYPNGKVASDPQRLLASPVASHTPPSPISSTAAGGYQSHKPQSIVKPSVTQTVSPSQTIPIPVTLAPTHNKGCNGVSVVHGETKNTFVTVCQENGQFFYIGQLKQDPHQPIKIPAWSIGQNKYQANNGSYSYLVSADQVQVLRHGSQIRTDTFHSFNK
ncbi:M23 family metallopeptidase [Aliinostoc sp. HNIBRCY26]|uniref:M23 family metallopeptidase n=1 Tax=Aliinostoc sp. HNIBRCY26 TaxID=3418997 RepID=UPI003CFF2594